MFIGHFAVGFAGKRAAPKTSLATLILAPIFLDILWPVFLLTGLERVEIDPGNTAFTPLAFTHYPWSHSLLMSLVWALLFGWAYLARTGYARGALWLGVAVTSHWFLDWVTHRPDLPLYPGGPLVGLGLWNTKVGTVVVEGVMFVVGLGIYLRTTRAKNWIGSTALWAFVALLLFADFGTIQGAPPPNVKAIVIADLVAWIVIPWAWWIDRNRELRFPPAAASP